MYKLFYINALVLVDKIDVNIKKFSVALCKSQKFNKNSYCRQLRLLVNKKQLMIKNEPFLTNTVKLTNIVLMITD